MSPPASIDTEPSASADPPEPSEAPDAVARPFPVRLVVAGVLATVVLAVAIIVAVHSGSPTSGSPPAGPTSTFAGIDRLGVGGSDLTGKPLPAVTYRLFGSDATKSVADQYKGHPLVINFWSSTCAPCVTEMPAFQKVHEQFGDQVAFLGLDTTDAEDSGQAMLDKTKVRYDVGRDPTGDALVSLGGSVLPTTILVSADGTVKLAHGGEFSGDDLTAAITQNLLS
jgi:cytochrome c biogenesis protein CcmG/thiol:disulfide interchange protein DsbE